LPQLVDRAKLLPHRFPEECMFIADTPEQYGELFRHMIANPEEANSSALRALEAVFGKHTTFHRADAFLSSLSTAGLLGQ
jgi:hypothetical protein